MSSSPFPSFPVSQIAIPSNKLINAAHAYAKQHITECALNHCLRGVAFTLIIMRKLPPLAAADLDTEAIVLSVLLHDLGWATDKSLLSNDKRFEVDGANMAREFVKSHGGGWDRHRLQLLWDAIALHTTPSIAHHKEPEVLATQLGVMADFFGPNLPLPGQLITVEEYKEVVTAFPRLGFKDELVKTMCGLCRDKKETTFDNFVADFGLAFGLDGKGTGKKDYTTQFQENNISKRLLDGLTACEQWD